MFNSLSDKRGNKNKCIPYFNVSTILDAKMTVPNNRKFWAAAATTSSLSDQESKVTLTPTQAIQHAVEKGWHGGKSGAMAMGINVCTLMWIRTTMNYQYRYGTTTTQAMR